MKRTILVICTTVITAIAILFISEFTNRLTLNYNSEGNYFDESSSIVYHTQAVFVYGILSVLLIGLTSLLLYFTIKSFKAKKIM